MPELQAGASAFLASEAVVAVGTGRRGEMRWSTPELLELASDYTALSRGREASAVYVVRDEEEGREPPVVTEMEDLAAKLRRSQAKELASQTTGADVARVVIRLPAGWPSRRPPVDLHDAALAVASTASR